MTRKMILAIATILFVNLFNCRGGEIDSLEHNKDLKFRYSALVAPVTLIGFGSLGIRSDKMIGYNKEIREEFTENIDHNFTIDDFSQYAPFVSVYALNGFGIKGENDFKDRTIILASAYLVMSCSVLALKSATHVERPDGSSRNSFPSGHTATAFMGAEFLYQEYKDVSIWYGVGGYAVAAATGFFRMYNNRHWLTDVAAGAGIGMLSTKIAYWSFPFFRDIFSRHSRKSSVNAVLLPYYNGRQSGLSFAVAF